jgi:hypothetical protein
MTELKEPVQAIIGEYADYVSFDFLVRDGKLTPNHPEEWFIPKGYTVTSLVKSLFPAWVLRFVARKSD